MIAQPKRILLQTTIPTIDDDWSIGAQWLALAGRAGLRARVPALLTVDTVLRRRMTADQSLALIVQNLGNSAGYDPASSENDLLRVPRERRSVSIEWRAQF